MCSQAMLHDLFACKHVTLLHCLVREQLHLWQTSSKPAMRYFPALCLMYPCTAWFFSDRTCPGHPPQDPEQASFMHCTAPIKNKFWKYLWHWFRTEFLQIAWMLNSFKSTDTNNACMNVERDCFRERWFRMLLSWGIDFRELLERDFLLKIINS